MCTFWHTIYTTNWKILIICFTSHTDICPHWYLSLLKSVNSICPQWHLPTITFAHNDICPQWHLSTLTFVHIDIFSLSFECHISLVLGTAIIGRADFRKMQHGNWQGQIELITINKQAMNCFIIHFNYVGESYYHIYCQAQPQS